LEYVHEDTQPTKPTGGTKTTTTKPPAWTNDIDKIWNKIKHYAKKSEANVEKLPDGDKKEKQKKFCLLVNKCIDTKDALTLHKESEAIHKGLFKNFAKMILDLEQDALTNPGLEK